MRSIVTITYLLKPLSLVVSHPYLSHLTFFAVKAMPKIKSSKHAASSSTTPVPQKVTKPIANSASEIDDIFAGNAKSIVAPSSPVFVDNKVSETKPKKKKKRWISWQCFLIYFTKSRPKVIGRTPPS